MQTAQFRIMPNNQFNYGLDLSLDFNGPLYLRLSASTIDGRLEIDKHRIDASLRMHRT